MDARVRSACLSLIVVIALSACGTASINIATPQTKQTPAPMATEKIFALTKMGMLTGEAETETAVSPKNGATVTAIVAGKFTEGTRVAETMTAMWTETPTPAIPTDSRFCNPADLKTSFFSDGMTGNILLEAGFKNISNSPCYMQALPQVRLVDGLGNPLDVDYSYQDISASDVASVAAEKIGLWSGWDARLALIWFDYRTWCGVPSSGNLVMQVTLMNNLGVLKVPTDFRPGSHCDTPGTRTSVSITKLELMLPATLVP